MPSLERLTWKETLRVFAFVEMGLNLLTYFLQMIVSFFVDLPWWNAIKFKRCWIIMRWHRVR